MFVFILTNVRSRNIMMLIKNKRSLFSKTIALCSDRRSHDRQTTKRRETMTEKSMIMNRKRNRKQCMVKRYSCLFTAILITFLILAVSLSICFTVNADQEKPKRHPLTSITQTSWSRRGKACGISPMSIWQRNMILRKPISKK